MLMCIVALEQHWIEKAQTYGDEKCAHVCAENEQQLVVYSVYPAQSISVRQPQSRFSFIWINVSICGNS